MNLHNLITSAIPSVIDHDSVTTTDEKKLREVTNACNEWQMHLLDGAAEITKALVYTDKREIELDTVLWAINNLGEIAGCFGYIAAELGFLLDKSPENYEAFKRISDRRDSSTAEVK